MEFSPKRQRTVDDFVHSEPCLHTESSHLLTLPSFENYLYKDSRKDYIPTGIYDYIMWLEIRNRFIGDNLLNGYYE